MNSIGGFLGNDSTFGKLMTKVGTIIAANIMFAVCCIPFVTVGAAQKALYQAASAAASPKYVKPPLFQKK